MKVIKVGSTTYYIQSKDDMINLTRELAKQGYDISEIAKLLEISERTVKRYLSDCW